MKRYVLFGNTYEFDGGLDDYIGSFDTVEEAMSAVERTRNWGHIGYIEDDGRLTLTLIGTMRKDKMLWSPA